MLPWMMPNLINEDNKDYRRLVITKIIIFFAFAIMIFFTTFHYFNDNAILFVLDAIILLLLIFFYAIFRNRNIYLLAKILLFIMSVGLLCLIYLNEGKDSVTLWSIVLLFYLMPLYGYKKGLIISSSFFIIVFFMLYDLIGISISFEGYVRFAVVCFVLTLISFAHEYSTQKTLEKLFQMKNSLNELTKIDSLTKLYNRRYFDEVFLMQKKLAKRNGVLFVFAIVDIDFFKLYNDTYGHQAGDRVLVTVANAFKKHMKRVDDYVFRLGGEEFGIVFHAQTQEDALHIMEALRIYIENLGIEHVKNTISPCVTVSIGMQIVQPNKEVTQDEVFKLADNALYEAKLEGRNRVKLSTKNRI